MRLETQFNAFVRQQSVQHAENRAALNAILEQTTLTNGKVTALWVLKPDIEKVIDWYKQMLGSWRLTTIIFGFVGVVAGGLMLEWLKSLLWLLHH